jgi:hypothetical protein
LPRSNVWAIVPLVMRGPTTVFTHRGLPPHQFTPMSGAHKAPAPNRRPRFPVGGMGGFEYRFCARPSSSAAVGEPQR